MDSLATFFTFALVIICVGIYMKLMRRYNTAAPYVIGAAAILGGWLIMYNYIHTNILTAVKFLWYLILVAPGWNL